MNKGQVFIGSLLLLLFGPFGTSHAATFSDSLTSGINSSYWSVLVDSTNIYSVATGSDGVTFTKNAAMVGSIRDIGLDLKIPSVTGGNAITGDFSAQVDFKNAQINGGGLDQVELHVISNGNIFFDVRDYGDVHVWDGNIHTGFNTNATSGTFMISRVGSEITGYFNGTKIWGKSGYSGSINDLNFILQNNNGSNDQTSVTFSNFKLTAPQVVPTSLPAAIWLFGSGLVGLLGFKRKSIG